MYILYNNLRFLKTLKKRVHIFIIHKECRMKNMYYKIIDLNNSNFRNKNFIKLI